MYDEKARVESIEKIISNTYLLRVYSPLIASVIKPGQFCNIKVSDSNFPLLRRPFSICEVEGNYLHFMFDVHGEGTRLLAKKNKNDFIDVLGPLGNGFTLNGEYTTAIIVAGGIGIAPFPFLIQKLSVDKKVACFFGGRSKENVIDYKMKNISIATDDGSEGFKGNVVQLLENEFHKFSDEKVRIFACGPTPMLKAIQDFSIKQNVDCQISTECAMACGFGICQGCPIESTEEDGYYLVCKDGPVFDSKKVKL